MQTRRRFDRLDRGHDRVGHTRETPLLERSHRAVHNADALGEEIAELEDYLLRLQGEITSVKIELSQLRVDKRFPRRT